MRKNIKSIINNLAKNDNIKVMLAIFVLFLGLVINNFSINQIMDWKYFSSIVLAAIFLFIVNIIQSKLLNYTEDTVKITEDYDLLVKKYNNVDFVKTKYGNNIVVSKVMDLENKNIIIDDDSSFEKRYQIPSTVKSNYTKILKSHSTSVISNSKSIRLCGCLDDGKNVTLKTHRTTYYDFLVTNLACDYEFDKNLTIRELYEPGPYFSSIEKSRLANRLGFDFFYKTKDNYILFVYRDNKKVMAKNTFSFSLSNNISFSEDKIDFETLDNQIKESIKQDILNQKFDNSRIYIEDVVSVNWKFLYRDIHHCGVPKILIEVDINYELQEILGNNFFSEKIQNSLNNLWVNVVAFDKESFLNDLLILNTKKCEGALIPAKNNAKIRDFMHKNFRGFSNGNMKTTPAIAGALYLFLSS